MNSLQQIQEWYKTQCNGDWEHEYGIKIETIDNPGWYITIDLVDTALEGFHYEYNIEEGETWLNITANGKVFTGAGDFSQLETILSHFIENFALPNIKNTEMSYTAYEEITTSAGVKVYKPIIIKPVSLTEFKVVSIPSYDFRNLKVIDIEDFDKINFYDESMEISHYKVGDNVRCCLVTMYDYPSLVIHN